jgi:hypothetical protein
MELEFRTKEGVLVAKLKGKSALYQYQKVVESYNFSIERKSLKKSKEPEYKSYLVMTCKVESILTYGEMEIWLAKGDYIKIT